MFPSPASTNCHPFPLIEIHRSRRLLGLATGVTGVESQKQLGSWKTIASRCPTLAKRLPGYLMGSPGRRDDDAHHSRSDQPKKEQLLYNVIHHAEHIPLISLISIDQHHYSIYFGLVQPDQATVCHCSTTTGDMGDIGDTGDRCATTTGEDIGDVNTVEMGDATGLRAMPAMGV